MTSLVQVYASKEQMGQVLGDGDLNGLVKATASSAGVPWPVHVWNRCGRQ